MVSMLLWPGRPKLRDSSRTANVGRQPNAVTERKGQTALFGAATLPLLYLMQRSPEEAEEAAQDALVRAWQKLGAFRGDSTFRTWLLSIAWNRALSRRRSIGAWFARPGVGAVVAGLVSATVFALLHGPQNAWLFGDRFAGSEGDAEWQPCWHCSTFGGTPWCTTYSRTVAVVKRAPEGA